MNNDSQIELQVGLNKHVLQHITPQLTQPSVQVLSGGRQQQSYLASSVIKHSNTGMHFCNWAPQLPFSQHFLQKEISHSWCKKTA